MDGTHSEDDSPRISPPAWIRPYLFIPYDELNCWQLCGHVLRKEAGIQIPSFEDEYEATTPGAAWDHRVREAVSRVVKRERETWQKVLTPTRFDIALYSVRETLWHVALVVGHGWALNTNLERGSHPITLVDSRWARRLDGYYRAPAPDA